MNNGVQAFAVLDYEEMFSLRAVNLFRRQVSFPILELFGMLDSPLFQYAFVSYDNLILLASETGIIPGRAFLFSMIWSG